MSLVTHANTMLINPSAAEGTAIPKQGEESKQNEGLVMLLCEGKSSLQ